MLWFLCIFYDAVSIRKGRGKTMVVIRASQKLFSEAEVVTLTGLCLETLHQIARSKHIGSIKRAAEAAGQRAEEFFFTNADLMVLNLLTTGQREAKD